MPFYQLGGRLKFFGSRDNLFRPALKISPKDGSQQTPNSQIPNLLPALHYLLILIRVKLPRRNEESIEMATRGSPPCWDPVKSGSTQYSLHVQVISKKKIVAVPRLRQTQD